MNDHEISQYILDTFDGVNLIVDNENSFFFYDPDNKIPFITIVTNNSYDDASDLGRKGVFRLNIGIGKQTYRSIFPAEEAYDHDDGASKPEYDFRLLDRLMPHPVYGRMYWVCVLNPGESTIQTVRTLLAEAYEIAVTKYERIRAARS